MTIGINRMITKV